MFARRLSTSLRLYEESAMTQRMKQILEEKIHNASTTNFIDKSVQKQASSYIQSEPLLSRNQHAKAIYNFKPWTGEESMEDVNLRMIIDSKPKAKPINDPISFKPRRKVSNMEKLSNAKDITLDYKVSKPDDNFREMYKERLLGPLAFNQNAPATDLVNSLASAKINSYINRETGRFDQPEMASVRGKKLSEEHLRNCTDTNYFMNQIMKKQEVIPPWIESQQSINKSIDAFRINLDQLWFNWIVNHSFFKMYLNMDLETILFKFEENVWQFTNEHELPEKDYITAKVDLINQDIRNYNLQCPSSNSHKMKLQVDKELKNSYQRVLEDFSNKIESWYNLHKKKSKLVDKAGKGSGFLNLWGDSGQSHLKSENTNLNFWQAVKDIFK